MKKVRVHELAKKYNINNKDLLAILRDDIKIEVSSHLSGLEDEDVKRIEEYLIQNEKKAVIDENAEENKEETEKETESEEKETEEKETEEKETEKEESPEEEQPTETEDSKDDSDQKEDKIIEEIVKSEAESVVDEKIGPAKRKDKHEKNHNRPDEDTDDDQIKHHNKFKDHHNKEDRSDIEDIEELDTDIITDNNTESDNDEQFNKVSTNKKNKKEKNRKKKGKRSDFVVKTVENNTSEVIEEDGIKIIKIKGEITLGEFAEKLGVGSGELIKKLFLKGQMLTINSPISIETASEIADEYDTLVEKEEEKVMDFGEKFDLEIPDRPEDLVERPPVITIMGHVDHGKTSLLDAIRSTNVVEGEAGGITQKIGAYQVIKDGKQITFVDTPGHEAFTDMRARGAQVTDIAILVVAADDGVMPQTIEAIAHARAADVPIIVAINKIDKPDANPMKVKQELMEQGIVSAEWGGDTEFVEVSAKKRLNLDSLLDTILITSEILELKANYKKRAKGVVLESRLDPKVGPIVDIIIQEGVLKIGDVIVAGEANGKVRALVNDKGGRIDKVGVSQPAEIIGFNQVPEAGETMYVIQNEQHAKRIVEEMAKERRLSETKRKNVSLESLSDQFEHENIKELNLVLRADSRGSVDALRESLNKLSNDEVAVNIIQATSGAITEGDIKLAGASNAIIIGFNVRPTTKAIKESELLGVEIRTSNIIYHITEDIEKALSGMLAPEFKEVYLGRIEIKKVFKVSKVGNIAGCFVIDGKVKNDSQIRILRNGVIVYEGKLSSLKRYKDDAKEVAAGQECGLGIENYNDIKEGDIVEAFEMQEIKRELK